MATEGWAKRWIKGLCVCVRLDETAERVLVQCLTSVWQLALHVRTARASASTSAPGLHLCLCLCLCLSLRFCRCLCLHLYLALPVARLVAPTPEAAPTRLRGCRDSRHQPET